MKISHIIFYNTYLFFTFLPKFPLIPPLRNKTRASDGRPSPPNVVPKTFRSPDSLIPLLHSPWSLTIPFRTFLHFIFLGFYQFVPLHS